MAGSTPDGAVHDGEIRFWRENDYQQVTVPLHDELATGTLRGVAESAGARKFDSFCK